MDCQQDACPFLAKWCILGDRDMKTYSNKLRVLFDDLGWLTLLVAGSVVISIVGFWHTQTALAAQIAGDYCNQYATNDQKNACKDGLKGTNCQNYADAGFDTTVVDICKKAAADLAAGNVKPGDVKVPDTTSPTPSASPTPSTSPKFDATNVDMQNYLNQAKSLSDYVDLLHSAGTDSKVDTSKADDSQYGSYVNGAGKQQPIKTLNAGTGKSPAILFFNGGGWHANDLMGERVADGKDGAIKPGDLGYAMFDVSYRLGSSGVYYMFEDVMRGIKHMHDNANKYGIDPNKIVIWGDSAGGSLTMRAAASGKSGAKVAVGWSAPTNGYTALFHSLQSFAIGMDHSTCVPTDLAGFTNFANLLNGGSGDVAQYGQGLTSNQFDSLGIGYGADGTFGGGGFDSAKINPLALLTEGMIAGKNALSFASDVESISDKIKGKTPTDAGTSLTGSTINLASKKIPECLNNFNALSPALFASPETPPSFLADFEVDGVISPDQTTGMRDKLRQMGIKSDALMLPVDDECGRADQAESPVGSGGCHLGYYYKFVCPTLAFVNDIIMPEKKLDCGAANPAASPTATNPNGGSNGSGGSGNSNNGNGGGCTAGSQVAQPSGAKSGWTYSQACNGQSCPSNASQSVPARSGLGDGKTAYCASYAKPICDTWDSKCNGGSSLSDSPQTPRCPNGLKYITAPVYGTNCVESCPLSLPGTGIVFEDDGDRCIKVANSQ